MKKAVIFDMDGLMFDSERATWEEYQGLLKEWGQTMTLEFYKKMLGMPLPAARRLMREEYGEDFPIEEAISQVHIRLDRRFRAQGVPIKPGLMEILSYVREAGLGALVATSSERERVEVILKLAGVRDYFQDIICGSEVANGKPAPDIFLKGCEKLSCAPSEAWVLEDSEAGILSASRAGIDCICVPDMKEPGEEYEKLVYRKVGSLVEAMEVIRDGKKD